MPEKGEDRRKAVAACESVVAIAKQAYCPCGVLGLTRPLFQQQSLAVLQKFIQMLRDDIDHDWQLQ